MLGCKLRIGTLKTKESWGGLVRVPLGHRVDLIYGEEGATPNFVGRSFFSPKSRPNRLATLFGKALRALAFQTCDDLRSLWSRSNLHTSQCKFFTVWPPNASQVTSSNLLLAKKYRIHVCQPWNGFLVTLRKLASPFGLYVSPNCG